MSLYQCPKCGQEEGFVEELTHCTVVRRVDGELNHVKTINWEPTGDTFSVYYCDCGARLLPEDLVGSKEEDKGV